MPSRNVTVGSTIGLHARPAATIAEKAGEFDAEITLRVEGQDPVSASSALLIMTLGAQHGDSVEVVCDDSAATHAISDLISQDLDA